MSEQNYAYPFDPTGQESTNRIINERHTINPPDYTDYYFVVPLAGPFFQDNLIVRHWPSGQTLVEGVDFVLGYQFLGASRATAKPVYGAISIYDRVLTGVLEVTYSTLGGQWTINEEAAAELLANVMANPRITTWEQVVEQPATFPVIDHEWNLVDLVGASEVVDSLEGIRVAIAEGGSSTNVAIAHIADENNPHNTTKAQVGLGLLQNFPVASINEAIEGTLNNRYMTPLRVKDAVESQVAADFRDHVGDFENPHEVTKTQIGLGQVQNFPVAGDSEARAGFSNAHYMTPSNVLTMIEEKVGTDVGAHVERQDNPHQVTQAQVGLGSVPNFPMATVSVATTGNAPDYFMSPYHTKLLINEIVGGPLSDHISDFNNPHSVTKGQVGLGNLQNFGIASETDAQEAVAADKYMTPYAVRLAINELVGGSLAAHPGETNNPHNVTKAQIGLSNVGNFTMATSAIMETGTSLTHYVSPKRVVDYVANGVSTDLTTHIQDINNPHDVTSAQVGLGNVDNFSTSNEVDARAGTRSDLFITPQGAKWAIDAFVTGNYGNLSNRLNSLETTQETQDTTITDHISDFNNPHGVSLDQLDGYTRGQVDDFLLQKLDVDGTAADTVRLDGLTRVELVESIEVEAADTYVTNIEITTLTNNLTTSFEDGMWDLNGGNVIRLQSGSLSSIYTQTTDRILDFDGDPNSRWVAVGSGGLAGYSTDNGINWTEIVTGITEDIAFVRHLNGQQWVFVTTGGDIYRSSNGGVNWSLESSFGQAVVSVENIGAAYVLVVGVSGMTESSDGGVTWSAIIDLSTLPSINDAALSQSQEVYLATDLGLYQWTGNGTEALVTAVPDTVVIEHVELDSDGHVVAVEQSGIHHRYSAINLAWQQIDHTRQLKELSVDKYNLWAAITVDNEIVRSIDGGRFWAKAPTSPEGETLWSIGSGETGWLVGGDGGLLYLSID